MKTSNNRRFPAGKHLLTTALLCAVAATATAADKGNPIDHYIVYKNGTVFDSKTGLTWKRCSQNQRWSGKTCTGEAITEHYGAAYKSSPNFVGRRDWMLPNIRELATLIYCPSGKPAFYPWLPDNAEDFKASQLKLSPAKWVKKWRHTFDNPCQGGEQPAINTQVFPLSNAQQSPIIYWSETRDDDANGKRTLTVNFSAGTIAGDKLLSEYFVRLRHN